MINEYALAVKPVGSAFFDEFLGDQKLLDPYHPIKIFWGLGDKSQPLFSIWL